MSCEDNNTVPGPITIAVVGAGGNIGSHLVPHLARLSLLDEVLLVDPDVYQEKNLASQDIEEDDVGQRKVEVQRSRLLRIRPDLRVTAIADRVENLPLGLMRADVLLTCLDTRAARQKVNERAWWLGIPWIDAGVLGDQLLARVSNFNPRENAACLECGWSESDYASLEQQYPCDTSTEAIATNAPSGLGALAAALQALELQKHLSGEPASPNMAHEFLIDARGRQSYSTSLRRNTACRFSHQTMRARALRLRDGHESIRAIVQHHHAIAGEGSPVTTIGVPGQAFAQHLACPNGCAEYAIAPHVLGRIASDVLQCPGCGSPRIAPGFSSVTHLELTTLPDSALDLPVDALGLRERDVVTLRAHDGVVFHYEIRYDSRD